MENIQSQFNKVLRFSQGLQFEPNTDKLFELWEINKAKFWGKFFPLNEYIYEFPQKVSFELDKYQKDKEVSHLIRQVLYQYNSSELALFIEENRDNFYSNQTEKEYKTGDIVIPKGMKITKAFKFFISDKDILNEVQSKASLILQSNKIEGTLCISIHPLDFLSLSENNHNWRSCHALDGEYRSGNLSYMADEATAICYLKSDNKEVLPRFPEDVPWNSKKWRMLLFASERGDMLFAGRQYPFCSDGALEKVDELLNNYFRSDSRFWTVWMNNCISEFQSDLFDETINLPKRYILGKNYNLVSINHLINEPQHPLHFNDLTRSSTYNKPYYKYKTNHWGGIDFFDRNTKKSFNIGQDVPCLCCGQNFIENNIEIMSCTSCFSNFDEHHQIQCSCCGNYFDEEEICYYNDNAYCENCYNDNFSMCDVCYGDYPKDTLVSYEGQMHCYNCLERRIADGERNNSETNSRENDFRSIWEQIRRGV